MFKRPPASLITALLQGLQNFNISDLDLSQNQIGTSQDAGTVALGQFLPMFSRLRSLNLSFNSFGSTRNQENAPDQEGLVMLGMSFPALSELAFFNLSNSLGTAAIDGKNPGLTPFFQGAGKLTTLQSLDLSGDGFSDTNQVTSALSQLVNLTYLDLSGSDLGYTDDKAVVALAQVLPSLVRLRHLNLSQNNLGTTGDQGFSTLAQGIKNLRNLIYLDLSSNGPNNIDMNNQIGLTSDQGTIALGESFGFLPNLAYVDLSGNMIGLQGNNGTAAIGRGLGNNRVLKTLNLAGNNLGVKGSEGLEVLLNSVVREGLNLTLTGAVNIPWTVGASALAKLNAGPIAEACEQQKCFGGNTQQSTTTTTPQNGSARRLLAEEASVEHQITSVQDSPWDTFSVGQRNVFSAAFGEDGRRAIYRGVALEVPYEDEVENISVQTLDAEEPETAPSSFFLIRWIQAGAKAGSSAVSGWVSRLAAATKELVYDDFGDWLTKKLADAAHEVTWDNHAYFSNIHNPNVRDWPTSAVYLNTTSSYAPLPALPAGR